MRKTISEGAARHRVDRLLKDGDWPKFMRELTSESWHFGYHNPKPREKYADFIGQFLSEVTQIIHPRRLDAEGKVTSSEKVIYTISEDDIINTAAERGIKLTPEQLDEAVRYFEKGFSASCGWSEVAGMALDAQIRW